MVIDTGGRKSKNNVDMGLVYVNDFGDNYHKLDNEPTTELEKEARKIRRRYRSFKEYKKAYAVYIDYMNQIENKYGNDKYFNLRMKTGTIDDFIPPLPKMKKNNKINDFIVENGVVISDTSLKMTVDDELVEKYEQDNFDETEEPEGHIVEKNNDKVLSKIVEKGLHNKNTFKLGSNNALELLAKFFEKKEAEDLTPEKDKEEADGEIVLSDFIDGAYDKTDDDESYVWYRGKILSGDDLKEMQLYNKFSECGWNSLAMMKKISSNNNLQVSSILRENKRKEKLSKKQKKRQKASKAAGDFLVKMIGENDESFSNFEDEMLDFSIQNVFK